MNHEKQSKMREAYSWCFIFSLLLIVALPLKAEPTPSAVQSREWKEPHPDLDILHSDKITDYKRDGKLVFRLIERTTNASMKTSHERLKEQKQHLIEFVANGRIFAVAFIDREVDWTVASGDSVYVSAGATGPDRNCFFQVCVPKYDYYEFVLFNGVEVNIPARTPESYARSKETFAKLAERGCIGDLKDPNVH